MKHVTRLVSGIMLKFEVESPKLVFYDNLDAVGGVIWPASDILVNFLARNVSTRAETYQTCVASKSILELGSGCGYAGISCGVLGAKRVILTDMLLSRRHLSYDFEGILTENDEQPSTLILDTCETNIQLNRQALKGCEVQVHELKWGERNVDKYHDILKQKISHIDFIIGSDLAYLQTSTVDLFFTVRAILRQQQSIHNKCSFILSHEHRIESSTKNVLFLAESFGLKWNLLYNSIAEKCSMIFPVASSDPSNIRLPRIRNCAQEYAATTVHVNIALDARKSGGEYSIWEFYLACDADAIVTSVEQR
jgi:predicted nicotinamide N-methyase